MYTAIQPMNHMHHFPMETNRQFRSVTVDYTNLYIKNLDLEVDSIDLHTHFRVFGKIVSARVMKHPQTNQSRGFGFVSFSCIEDAVVAKEKMNGQRILSKPILIAFHEPKKIKEEPMVSLYPEKRMREDNMVYKHVPEKINKFNHNTQSLKRQTSAPLIHTSPSSSPNHGLFIPVYSPKVLRRSGSAESMATTAVTQASAGIKRQAIVKAICQMGEERNSDLIMQDIVDMLLTLKKKDLATCLFNKTFLKAEIKRAKEALELFKDEEPIIQKTKKKYPVLLTNIQIPPKYSRAIPIVAPTDATDHKKELDTKKLEIENFLKSLKDLSLYEQKQMLGDKLFPLVKATGVKQAPRVTICLLDSIVLEELAHLMYDQQQLKFAIANKVN
ncbi:hypothetical protein BY458DRAFT_517108 [Sporodiniella umbellata]|nr:hypothetical protein BY458DRAFT_517108 [Sporodiniella umbellata]